MGGNQGRLSDDVSGRIDVNHIGNDQEQPAQVHYNPFGEHAYNNQGRFIPPPPSHLLGGRGNMNRNYRQDFESDNEDQFSVHNSEQGDLDMEDRRFRMFEECLKAIEGHGVLGMDANDMGLVPGIHIPMKFKPPVFEKYNGLTCPKTHATAYYRKMSAFTKKDGVLIHFFQDSLSGASLEWYMKLERSRIKT